MMRGITLLPTILSLAGLATSRSLVSNATCSSDASVRWLPDCSAFAEPSVNLTQFDCGYLSVPNDYANCSAGTVDLAIARKNATALPRMGSIFVNPGGPGGEGVQYVFNDGDLLMNNSGGHYDIVSWDPRGVGFTSILIDCFDSELSDPTFFTNRSLFAGGLCPGNTCRGPAAYGNFTNANHTDPDEVAFWKLEPSTDVELQRIGAQCLARNGANLTYVGTASTARDILSLSDAIEGAGKAVNYWGVSYGTVLGSTFVNMFPDRVGRLIIDGVVNPTYWWDRPQYQLWGYQIQDAHLDFEEFTRSCAAAGDLCAIAKSIGANVTQDSVAAWFQDLINLAFTTYNSSDPNSISSSQVRAETYGGLYTPSAWTAFASSMVALKSQILQGTASVASLSRRNEFGSRSPYMWTKPSFGTSRRGIGKRDNDPDHFDFATQAIACGDAVDIGNTTTADIFNEVVYSASNVSQMFGTPWDFSYYCHQWPARAVERYHGSWNASLANPILVIGNVGDNATPLASARTVAGMLGSSAVLLVRDGYGHSSIASSSACTAAVISAYFTEGIYPTAGTICATDKNYFGVPSVSNDSSSSSILSTGPATSSLLFTSTSAPLSTFTPN